MTIQEISLRISQARAGTDGSKPVTAVEADISFSAQIGPVYLRVDRLGLALLADTGKPPTNATSGWSTCTSASSRRSGSRSTSTPR